MLSSPKRSARQRSATRPLIIEMLEPRQLLATVGVNVNSIVRAVITNYLGINLAWWDTALNTTQTKTMVQAAGLRSFRFPDGSTSDTFHFNSAPTYNGEGTVATFATFIDSVNGGGVVTRTTSSDQNWMRSVPPSIVNCAPSGNSFEAVTAAKTGEKDVVDTPIVTARNNHLRLADRFSFFRQSPNAALSNISV
jgi:hypothetical protein